MAAGVAIGSVELAQEPAGKFGSLAAAGSDRLPDASLNIYEAIEVMKGASFFDALEQPAFELDIERTGAWAVPDEIETVRNSTGSLIERLKASIVLRLPVRGLLSGGNHIAWTSHPIGWLLSSAMEGFAPAAVSDAVNGVGISANEWTPTAGASFTVGQIVAVDIDGVREYSTVTGVTVAPTVQVSPAFSRSLNVAAGDVVYPCYTWVHAIDGIGSAGRSLSARFNRLGRRYIAYGGRLAKLTGSGDGDRRSLVLDATIDFAFVRPEGSPTFTVPVVDPTADVAKALGSYAVMSSAMDRTALVAGTAAALSRTALEAQGDWGFELDFGLTSAEHWDTVLGMADMEIGDTKATVDLTLTPSAAIDAMRLAREERQLIVGCGPARAGQGFALALQAAHLVGHPRRDDSGPRMTQPTQWRAGEWSFDDSPSRPAYTSIKIGMPAV